MRNGKIAHGFATVATGMMILLAARSQQPTTGATKPAAKADSSQVYSIVLPQYTPDIPNGPNVDLYRKNCLLCHTLLYVSMQPRFSKTVWQKEVKKMVDAYGASISEADQALIVQYLVAVNGIEPQPSAPTIPK
jgi:cytochrome c5